MQGFTSYAKGPQGVKMSMMDHLQSMGRMYNTREESAMPEKIPKWAVSGM